MDKIKVQLLREHPRNKEFFDDIEGERWKDFVESIKTSGIIVPLVVTRDYTVVSGNQRLRAAKELGLEEVPCEVKTYEGKNGISKEDWILKDLIETNLRQRGIGNLNPVKTAKCIIELERIYGVKKGGYRGDLQNLDISNYSYTDYDDNHLFKNETVWIFGQMFGNVEVYIKLKIRNKVICLSFHEAIFDLKYPYL